MSKFVYPLSGFSPNPCRIRATEKVGKRKDFKELEVGGADDRYLEADVILRTGTSPTGVATQLVVLHLCPPVPVCVVVVELHPRLMALPPSPVGLFIG